MATFWRDKWDLSLIASLDEEAQEDLRTNKNFGTYKGAIYENVVGEMLIKSGYEQLYFYKHDTPSLEMERESGKFYTFPYFLAFLLKRFLKEKTATS